MSISRCATFVTPIIGRACRGKVSELADSSETSLRLDSPGTACQTASVSILDVIPLLRSQTDDRADARLTGLVELYNVLTDAGARLGVLRALLAFARNAELAHHLLPVIQVSGPV